MSIPKVEMITIAPRLAFHISMFGQGRRVVYVIANPAITLYILWEIQKLFMEIAYLKIDFLQFCF